MNHRYIIGKTLSNIGNTILASELMPLTRIVPQGISYPYDIKRIAKNRKIKTIFDVGANIGQTSRFLNWHFPQAEIFAFEPINETFKTLQKNTHYLNKIQCFHSALGSHESEKLIYIREDSELNTLIEPSELPSNFKKTETVKITTIDTIAKKRQLTSIDILKMDVQGYELEVIYGAEFYVKNNLINFIYAEIDFDEHNKECQDFGELNKFLVKNNFKFSGFYEVFRWGENKRYFGFCNALFVNCNL
ncbi:methyltransferase FkbM [Nostoc sp. HK-01]|nr:methyltransferase FkbM [Nostoc sp. HK-01]